MWILNSRNSITSLVQKQKKVDDKIELLKKQQKVECDRVVKEFDCKRTELSDSIEANIAALKAQIESLKNQKVTQLSLLEEEQKVNLDKVIHDYDQKILAKKHESRELGNLIGAQKKNMEDILEGDAPNTPTTTQSKQIGFTSETPKKNSKKK